MSRWIANLPSEQVVYFAACEVVYRRLVSLGIPSEPLGKHFGIVAGYAFKSGDYESIGIPLLRNINVKPDRIDWTETVCLPDDKAKEFERFRLDRGDLVMSMDGTVNKQGIKIAFLTSRDVPSLLLQRVCRFDPASNIGKRFLYHVLHTTDFLDHVDESNRSIAIPHVSPGQLKSFPIPVLTDELQTPVCHFLDAVRLGRRASEWPDLPEPLVEQRRVVVRIEELAAQIHEARTLRQQAAEEAEALPLAELFSVFSREAKQRGTTRLEDLLIKAGYGSSEKCNQTRVEGAMPVLRIPNVASERISLTDLKFARLSKRNSEKLLLSEGDVLVVRTNGSLDLVGRSAVVPKLDEPFAFASYMIRLRFDHNRIAPDYAQRMLQHLRVSGALVDFARTTAGQYNVSLGRLRAGEIPVPPLAEQRRIVAELDALQAEVDALKRLQAETTAKLDALLPSILDKAFKGEL